MQQFKKLRFFFLNIFQAAVGYLYFRPRKFIRDVFSKKGLAAIVDQLYSPNQSDETKALSAAFGVFMGIIPIWGFQTLVAIFLAIVFRLNKALVVIFSQISFPPMMPLIIFLSYRTGHYWMTGNTTDISFHSKISFTTINQNFEQYIYGSVTLAIVAGLTVGLLIYGLLKFAKALKQSKPATF